MGFSRTIIILFALILAPASAWAVHPFQVEDTSTQGAGNFLLELNAGYGKIDSSETTTAYGVVRIGAGAETDFVLEVPYLLLNPSPATGMYERGVGDVQLRLKQRIYENEVNQSVGYEIYSGFPTGEMRKGLGTNNVLLGARLMDQQKCRNTILHANVGYETRGRDAKQWHFAENYALLFGIAAEHKLTGSLRLLTELAGESRKTTDQAAPAGRYSRPLTFMAGFEYDLSGSWYVDLAARAGLNKYAPDYTALAGTAWKF